MIHWSNLLEKDNLTDEELSQIPAENITGFQSLLNSFRKDNLDVVDLLDGTDLKVKDFYDPAKWLSPKQSQKLILNYFKKSPGIVPHYSIYNLGVKAKNKESILHTIIKYTPYETLLKNPDIAYGKLTTSYACNIRKDSITRFSLQIIPRKFKKSNILGHEVHLTKGYVQRIHEVKNIKIKSFDDRCYSADLEKVIHTFYSSHNFIFRNNKIYQNNNLVAEKVPAKGIKSLNVNYNWSDDDYVYLVVDNCQISGKLIFKIGDIYNAPFDCISWSNSLFSYMKEKLVSKFHFDMYSASKKLNFQLDQNNIRSKDLLQLEVVMEQEKKSKEFFLANIVHEIKSPLSSIVMLIDSLNENLGDVQDFVRDGFKQLGDKSGKLITFVDNVMSYFSMENRNFSLNKESIDIAFLINDALDSFSYVFTSKKIALISTIPPDRYIVRADYYRLIQVFLNIIGNSVKFTEQGEITIDASFEGTFVKTSIKDTGVGIDPEKLETIFDKFCLHKDSIINNLNGIGLGLYVSREIIHQHNGKIKVESKLGEGSVFHIYLPYGF